MRDSFIFYSSFYEAIVDLPDEERLKCYDMICEYALTGKIPEVSGIAKSIFALIKPNVDASIKRRKNGAKGGRNNKKNKYTSTNNESTLPNYFQITSDNSGSNKEREREREEEREEEKERDVDVERDADADVDKDVESLSFSNENDCRTASVQRVIEEWNFLSEYGVKPVKTIGKDSTRYKMLCKRIADNGEGGVLDAINRIRGSDFLLGKKTDFLITFDWFVKPNNFAKVADGNYDNKDAKDNRQAFFDKWRDV